MFDVFEHLDRASLATLPTPLEASPASLPGGARLWVKRDDLTGLGGGGNKARKLEFLCGAAVAADAQALVTVGAAQSNHCRMTAAAGARLGIEVHLVLSGDEPERGTATGNQLLSGLFGAQLHFTGAPDHHWGELEIAREAVTDALAADGLRPYSIPIGGSTPTGALGYAAGFIELLDQLEAIGARTVGDRVHLVERGHPCRPARGARRGPGAGTTGSGRDRHRCRQRRGGRVSRHRRAGQRHAGADGTSTRR